MINLVIGDSSILIRLGIKALLEDQSFLNFLNDASNKEELFFNNKVFKPDLIIVDLESLMLNETEVGLLKKQNKKLKILGISKNITKKVIQHYLNQGVTSFLLKECDKSEIIEAITTTHQGIQFLCGKIAHSLTTNLDSELTLEYLKNVSCEGLIVSEREAEVIMHISNGLSNKQIADTMFLSTHTVNTHRKNIMNKLGVNNTAGIVMYAVRNNLLNNNPYLFSN